MSLRPLAFIVALASLIPSFAVGNENITLDDYSQLAQRVNEMEAQLASFQSGPPAHGIVSNGSCGDGCCRGGMFAGFDLVLAKPHWADGTDSGDSTYDFSFSPRFIVGYDNGCGTGVRVRYWRFDEDSTVSTGGGSRAAGDRFNLRLNVVDVEVTRDWSCGCLETTLLAGIRYADLEHRELTGTDRNRTDGIGPMLGIETRTPLCCGFDFVGNARYAALFGESFATSPGAQDDQGTGVVDIQLGIQKHRCTRYGTVKLSCMVEAQEWFGALQPSSDINSSSDDDFMMLGFVFGVELQR